MHQAKILIVGSYLVGLTMRMDTFPVVGQTLIGYQYQAMHGGKGSNQAVACARLGAQTAFAGCVGNDTFGMKALELFKGEGVDCTYTQVREDASTGVGFILVNRNGENMITLDTAACKCMNAEFADGLKDAINDYDIVLVQQEIPMEAVLETAKLTKQAGKKFILNPAPYCTLPEEIYGLIDVLVPNEGEARQIIGLKPEDESVGEEEIADMIRKKGVANVVITLGEKGVFYRTADDGGYVAARKVDAVDTTGAGDTFTAALSVALGEGNDMQSAVAFAQQAASISVCKYGVIESLPFRQQMA